MDNFKRRSRTPGRLGDRLRLGLLAGLALLASATVRGVEPWADPAVPVKNSLVLWLDAGRQAAARAAYGLPGNPSGSAFGVWFDGSGGRRDLAQRRGEAQARLISTAGKSVVRFDGKDDSFERIGLDLRLDGATFFLVARPFSNLGGFRGLLSANQAELNDYLSGLTIDLGPFATTRFDFLNVEGKGFAGARNLLTTGRPFHEFHLLQVVVPPGAGDISARIDDLPPGRRPRQPGVMRLDALTVGARFYSNEPRPPYVQGFFHGDIAEVLVFDRALEEDERHKVAAYLAKKHDGLSETVPVEGAAEGLAPLKTVANPPAVQMLVPGFSVRELPIKLSNVNNVRYREDGTLVALTYRGDIYLLTDRDGDGLEDQARLFWENKGRLRGPIGMALTPPGYSHGRGVFVASKGKCSLIVDTDGDDRADREIVAAQGWAEITQAVDTLGVAVGRDQSVWFGLGTADFTNAYLVDGQEKAHYDLNSERGTIIRLAPDFRSREIVATGIRFPVGLAFNREGDLFATDQEGATWLPNGNPFDELLHIRAGRHYGFPPRHSRHLPNVIDEPSVFDYAPQHQSTCGLFFNEPVNRGPVFGPAWWSGNALVSGYSRGKLYRTELVKVRGEYVARTALIGVLAKLTVDSTVTPDGSLVVATHSGAPDWGSGPDGPGTLYKITYNGRELPQPVLAWCAGPRETRIAFDRPLDPSQLHGLAARAAIETGPAVAAGDRFETLRPGYAVVAAQLTEPRRTLAIRSAGMSPDRRTLILGTDPQSESVSFAVKLPGMGRPGSKPDGLRQSPETDLAYNLSGAEASWSSSGSDSSWAGWLPHLDLAVARAFAKGSADHDSFWPRVELPGTLTLRARLRLSDLLRPAVQPGSEVNDRLPAEKANIRFRSRGDIKLASPVGTQESSATSEGLRQIVLSVQARPDELIPIEITLATGPGATLEVDYTTNEDSRPRALPLSRILVPWARGNGKSTASLVRVLPPQLQSGDWMRGRQVFFGPEAQCSKCHRIRGEGGSIGPDLSNLVERDHDSVLRDITHPSAAINPDYVTYDIALSDGRILSGAVRNEGRRVYIGNTKGEETLISRGDVEDLKPQSVSIMPEGLPRLLGEQRMTDLLTFLLTPPFAPAPIQRDDAPPPRTKAEVDAVLGEKPAEKGKPLRPLKVLLVGGPKDHGLDEHDYPLWLTRWTKLLKKGRGVTVSTASDWPSADDLARADVMVWYSANLRWTAEKGPELDAFLARGGGLVVIHFALNGVRAPEELARRIGLAWTDGRSKFRHGSLDLVFPNPAKHPITAGFDRVHFVDESYWNLGGDLANVDVLATGVEDGQPQPLLWARDHGPGKGRVVCSVPGHYTWTFDDPLFRILILRGICWTAGEPVDRLSALATVGARLDDKP